MGRPDTCWVFAVNSLGAVWQCVAAWDVRPGRPSLRLRGVVLLSSMLASSCDRQKRIPWLATVGLGGPTSSLVPDRAAAAPVCGPLRSRRGACVERRPIVFRRVMPTGCVGRSIVRILFGRGNGGVGDRHHSDQAEQDQGAGAAEDGSQTQGLADQASGSRANGSAAPQATSR